MNETNETTAVVTETTSLTPSQTTTLSRNIDDTRVVTNANSINPYIQTPVQTATTTTNSLLGNFDTNSFVKGALIGAAATYILTNENVQKNIFKLFAKGSSMLQAGFEEIKERMEDAKAELEDEQI